MPHLHVSVQNVKKTVVLNKTIFLGLIYGEGVVGYDWLTNENPDGFLYSSNQAHTMYYVVLINI